MTPTDMGLAVRSHRVATDGRVLRSRKADVRTAVKPHPTHPSWVLSLQVLSGAMKPATKSYGLLYQSFSRGLQPNSFLRTASASSAVASGFLVTRIIPSCKILIT